MIRRCHRLLREADDLRYRDPREAVRKAESTRDLVASLDRRRIGDREWLLLQSEAWAVLGSNLRAVARLHQAESALNVALAFLEAPELEGRDEPLLGPRLAQRAAYLRCDQRRFDEALDLIDDALAAFSAARAEQAAAGALADRGLILGRSGHKPQAVCCLREALAVLDPEADLRNFLAAVHNLALYLHDLAAGEEEVREALRWLNLACRCHARLPESINLLKLHSLKARTVIRLGRIEAGLRDLWKVAEGFERHGAVYEQAEILLQLAGTYLSQGKTAAVRRVSGQLFPIYRRLNGNGVPSDDRAAAALMLFYKAAQDDKVTPDLIARASAAFRERESPNLFRP